MSNTYDGGGRFGNQLIRGIAFSILAKKHDLFIKYKDEKRISQLGIKLFSGSKTYENSVVVNDNNYFEHYDKHEVDYNILSSDKNSYMQTKEITDLVYEFLLRDDTRESVMNTNKFEDRYHNNNDVAIHVRLDDMIHKNPGFKYYDKVLSLLNFDRGYLCSDSPNHEICRAIITKYPNIEILGRDEIDTIMFTSTCKYLVMSNGTFSTVIGYLSYFAEKYYPSDKNIGRWHGNCQTKEGWIEVEP